MKATTKRQKAIEIASLRLKPITEAQKRYFESHHISKIGYSTGKNVWCTNCGEVFDMSESELITSICGCKCPRCGTDLEVTSRHAKKCNEAIYYTVVSVCNGYQVLRHYVVDIRRRRHFVSTEYTEVVQEWVCEDGHITVRAKSCRAFSVYYDAWNWNSDITIKGNDRKYHINSLVINTVSVLPIIRRNGFKGNYHNCTPSFLFRALLSSPDLEMLLKTKQYKLLAYCIDHLLYQIPYKYAVKICIRNNYKIDDPQTWIDHLVLLNKANKDLHNPKYICSKNLIQEHRQLIRREEERERMATAKAERERQQEKSELYNDDYISRMSSYLDFSAEEGDITIRPLQSVDEFFVEGATMHHCVAQCEYYKKEDTLILSARTPSGTLATIEYNLSSRDIMQIRGPHNSEPPRKDEIIQIFERNLYKLHKLQITA